MKVKVLLPFRDKDKFTRLYEPGDVVDFERERGEHIVELGLAEPVVEKKATYEPPKAEEVKEAPAEAETVEETPKEAPKPRKPRKKKTEL